MQTNTQSKRTVFSCEVFPPKREDALDSIYTTIGELKEIQPDFISVTYGAGGSDNCAKTLAIATAIKDVYGIKSVAHLPCIGLTKDDVLRQLDAFREAGIENILALRGDEPQNRVLPEGDFKHASDLMEFIRAHGNFHLYGACYPEGHLEAPSLAQDVKNLKIKIDAGAEHLLSQLFFDNEQFYRFLDLCEAAGIDVPIEAGIMPASNKKQIERMVSICGASLPKKFVTFMQKYEDRPEAMRDASIAYAVDQIIDLMAHGVYGIHLYTMNNPYIAKRIHEAIKNLL